MIRNLACAKAQIIHTQLRDVSKKATVIADTPLSSLISTSIAPMAGLPRDEKIHLNDSKITSMLSTTSGLGVFNRDEHDNMKTELVKMIASTVRRTLHLSRNVALPIIDDVTAAVDNELQKLIPATGVALSIQESPIVELINNSTLTQVVEKYREGTKKRDAPTVNVHTSRDAEAVYELIKVGYADFDDVIAKFLLPYLGSDVISKVYTTVFSADANRDSLSNLFMGSNQIDTYAKAIITLLIASALIKEDEDNIDMSASAYDNAMTTVIRWCGDKIIQGQDQVAYRKNSDTVVISFPASGSEGAFLNPQDAVIWVDPVTYRNFLDNGGTPEMVMGSYLVDRQTKGSAILVASDTYVNAYNRTITALKSNTQLQELMIMQRVLQRELSREIGEAATSEYVLDPEAVKANDNSTKGWAGLTLANADTAQKLLAEKIGKLNIESTHHIYETVRGIVLDIFFEGTDVRSVLDAIDSINLTDPDGDVQGAVNLAVVDYVVDWVMEQVNFVNTGE